MCLCVPGCVCACVHACVCACGVCVCLVVCVSGCLCVCAQRGVHNLTKGSKFGHPLVYNTNM